MPALGPALNATSLFGLAPGGVCRAVLVTKSAVRSYRTVSPLPDPFRGLRRFTLCCTFRGLAPPRRYLAPDPPEPGLSSILFREQRLPGRLPGAILACALPLFVPTAIPAGISRPPSESSRTHRCAKRRSIAPRWTLPSQGAVPSPTTQPRVSTSVYH